MKGNKQILCKGGLLIILTTAGGAALAAGLLYLILFLSACTGMTEESGRLLPEGEYPVEFSSQMEGLEVTRATSESTWAGTEQIAVQIGNETKKYKAETDGKITASAGETPFYWMMNNETKAVKAYYPFSLASANVLTVEPDQRAMGFEGSDALYAAATSISFADSKKELTFSHLPAKVVVNLKASDDVTEQEVRDAVVTFTGQSLSTPFDAATGVVTTASAGTSSILPNQLATPTAGYQKSVQALLLPCQMKGTKFIKVTVGSDTFYYIPQTEEDGKLTGGTCLTYAITVKRNKIEVELQKSESWTSGNSEAVASTPMASMSFVIDLTGQNTKTFTMPFNREIMSGYHLKIDWGDGSAMTIIPNGTDLASTTLVIHDYGSSATGEYTIQLFSSETDFSKEQIPGFQPGYYNLYYSNKKLKALLTPLLNTGETNFEYAFFDCVNLTGDIPKGFLDHNPQVTAFMQCFYNCEKVTSIPEGLFDKNVLTTTFKECFGHCEGLTSIPKGLFDKIPNVYTFYMCFMGCTNLTSIPEGLFDNNTQATNFLCCFYKCTNLRSIPEGLFAKNKRVTSFSECFMLCTKLTLNRNIFCDEDTESATRFLNNTVDFTGCFHEAGTDVSLAGNAGTAPALWRYTFGSGTTFQSCFTGIGPVTNASEIPSTWK